MKNMLTDYQKNLVVECVSRGINSVLVQGKEGKIISGAKIKKLSGVLYETYSEIFDKLNNPEDPTTQQEDEHEEDKINEDAQIATEEQATEVAEGF